MTEPDPADETQPKRGAWFSWLLTIGILGAGFVGFVMLQAMRQPPEPRTPQDRAVLVEAVPLRAGTGPLHVTGSGFITPVRDVALAARVGGAVMMVSPRLEPGSKVEDGEVLVELDQRPFQAALTQAEADKAATEADLAFINQQITRARSLNNRGFAAEERVDELISQRERNRATLSRLDALIAQRQLDLDFATLKAPFTGRVVSENVAVGQVVQVGAELARLYASDVLEIVLPLETREAALIPNLWTADALSAEDAPSAEITVQFAGGTYSWAGYVARAQAEIDRQTRTLDVIVRVPNPDVPGEPSSPSLSNSEAPLLRPGMFARVAIRGRVVPDLLIAPREAVRTGQTVWIIDAQGTLRIVPVEILAEADGAASLLAEGIRPGTRVIVGQLPVTAVNGLSVRTLDAATAAPANDARAGQTGS